jgi:peptide-methionine (R)-S-oxide reductase
MENKQRPDNEWQQLLSPEQYHITRQKGTEQAFSGKYYKNKESGMYYCLCCGEALFSSDTKYESGSGWPSFWEPVEKSNVSEVADNSHGMERIEVTCSSCGAHLGHVFPDGPDPTGLRYCINSASLDFKPKP